MSGDSAGERTEQASERQMKDIRKKGKLGRSADVSAWAVVGAAGIMIPMVAANAQNAAVDQLFFVHHAANSADPKIALQALVQAAGAMGPILLPILAVTFLVAVIAPFSQGKVHFRSMAPKFDHFNPVSAAKKIFGPQAVWNAVKALIKSSAVGVLMYMVIQSVSQTLMGAGLLPAEAVVATASAAVFQLIWYSIIAGLAMAAVDMFVVARRNRKQTKVTKQDAKREHKSSEGDPIIKSQRRSRQMAMSRNRMISDVSSASAVVVNPIHVAVAVRYDNAEGVPIVVASGRGEIAKRIREQAEEAKIPLIRNVPLAWVMHDHCRVGQPVPPELYAAVATVIAFTMKLDARAKRKRMHTIDDVELPDKWKKTTEDTE